LRSINNLHSPGAVFNVQYRSIYFYQRCFGKDSGAVFLHNRRVLLFQKDGYFETRRAVARVQSEIKEVSDTPCENISPLDIDLSAAEYLAEK
jgi:hypothetical protein